MTTKELLLPFDVFNPYDVLIERFLAATNPWWLIGKDSPKITVKQDLIDAFRGIDSLKELNEKIFWKQINQFRNKYKNDRDKRIRALRSVVYFYTFIIRQHPDLKLFEDARTLYPSLLENRAFVTEWLEERCSFLTFSPGYQYDGHENYIFIVRGSNRESSKMKEVDYKKVDLSSIHSPFYRKCAFNYTCSSINRLINYNPTFFNFSLNLLSDLKQNENYINKSEDYLIPIEIRILIEGLYIKSNQHQTQVQTYKGSFKAFLNWCIDNHLIRIDEKVLDEFQYFTGKSYVPKVSRPEAQHIDILLNASKAKAQENASNIVFDTILRLLLSTKLRVSSICSLERDCFLPQLKPGSYRIRFVSKTSHGDQMETTSITPREKGLLDKVMKYNESLLPQANPEYRNYIFIHIPNRKKYVRTVDKFSFGLYLKQLCKENDLPTISATQLRKEYHSQVERFATKEKIDEEEFKTLTGHAHIDTTKKHYAKARIEEYFEQLYMVQLYEKDITIKEKIVKRVPENLERVGDSKHQCGACNATGCMIKSALPCFVCKDFITSQEFLPVFKRMVDEIDERIIASANPHDKEDFTAIKEVLVRYIVELTSLSL